MKQAVKYNHKPVELCGCSTENIKAKVEAVEIMDELESIFMIINDSKSQFDRALSKISHALKKIDRSTEVHVSRVCKEISSVNKENKKDTKTIEDKLLKLAATFEEVRDIDNVERLIREKHSHDDFFDLLIEVSKLAKENKG